jgi:hypothetical protein
MRFRSPEETTVAFKIFTREQSAAGAKARTHMNDLVARVKLVPFPKHYERLGGRSETRWPSRNIMNGLVAGVELGPFPTHFERLVAGVKLVPIPTHL